MHWDGWWHIGWMWLFWIAVIVAVVFLVRTVAAPARRPTAASPEEILKQRYAQGEIDQEEYERRLSDLRR